MTGHCLFICPSPAHDVVGDVIRGLEERGWTVDTIGAPGQGVSRRGSRRLDGWLAHRNVVTRTAARLTRRLRREIVEATEYSAWFDRIDATLQRRTHDVAVAFLDGNPVGLARLLTRAHPRPVLLSLVALTQELRHARALPALRRAATIRARQRLHQDLFRAADPRAIPQAVFPSDAWRDAAVAAGLPSGVSSTIPLGVRTAGAALRRFPQRHAQARLLWAGRLSPEKGLHHFLDSLPHVRTRRSVTLTVIAASGPAAYARRITAQIDRLGLQDVVTFQPSVSRLELLQIFARHDLLLFHSIFAEPVAQVMLHAAASGLPIVGPASSRSSSLLRDGQTAWCYADASPECVADAIVRALEDSEQRTARARTLRAEVLRDHDLDVTIARFDALMRAQADRDAPIVHAWHRNARS